jgi:valyl-tRNA synthetase
MEKEAPEGLEKFTKPYSPADTESRIYKVWEESGYFNPDNLPANAGADGEAKGNGERSEPYTVMQPPPNVTGILHIGHAYESAITDTIVRYQRMRGKRTLWLPGTDSAAIATQARVEKNIQKEEGKSRHDLGRDELVRRVTEFAKSSENTILSQVRRLGTSLDWSRYAYTLDEKRTHAVSTAFERMYAAGLIYRGNRIVNWDPKGQTTISDDEIVYEERTAKLYTFKYSKNFPISVATTRLETKVGDVAVAVHPDDTRYKKFVGQEYDVVFCDTPLHIKIIADKEVDPEYGTGALGVTPAHSMIDWEIAERHDLPKDKIVISEYAKMTVTGRLEGMKVNDAREAVADWLRAEGLLEKEEDVQQNVSTSERTGGIIEPLPKLQWFIAVDKGFTLAHSEIVGIASGESTTLKTIMHAAIGAGNIDMPQENFRKTYFHWIDNLHDWCISRQIWFGHRIPVWYRGTEVHCGANAPAGEGWEQESDVLDTWFSSSLWTFSTLGWPEQTKDLDTYHPTSLISPAYEILPLWVSRMILMSGFHLGQVPFKTVLIHGLVRDKQGRKFSKSIGNGIDPIEMIDKYGADALRMGLLVGTAIGNDSRFDEDKVKGYKHFANKIWNVARFVLENTSATGIAADGCEGGVEFTERDQGLYDEFTALASDVTTDLEEYRMYLAAEKIYHYAWHRFADEILEESKSILNAADATASLSREMLLRTILIDLLKLLHPFMPFFTEEIWQSIPETNGLLIVAPWPTRTFKASP